MKTQNPNADVVIYDRPPFLVRNGIAFSILLLLAFYFTGNNINVPVKEKLEVTMELDRYTRDSLICHCNLDAASIDCLKKMSSFSIVDKENKQYRIDNIKFKFIGHPMNNYTFIAYINEKSEIQIIQDITDNFSGSCYLVINGFREPLSKYVLGAIFSLFSE